MKLLIITQKVDKEDPILGFFHNWIEKLSKKFEKISVICLEKGDYNLPQNVRVFSLGKESGRSKIKYIKNFMNLILGLHKEYDSVFIHMNQEYILLGGFIWKILRKKVYFWRNHQCGNLFTQIAIWLSNQVFYTSRFSFVAKSKKASIMPVGIDVEKFKYQISNIKIEERKNKILFLSRMSPIKKPGLLIEALNILNRKRLDFVCDFYGNPVPGDESYYDSLKIKVRELGLGNKIAFYKSVPNYETPKIYNEHEIFVNLTPSGSFDKTILEAAACGCIPIITNQSLSGEIDERMIVKKDIPESVAEMINFWLNISNEEREKVSSRLQKYVLEKHSLNILIEKLCITIRK
jgi:glycosyltransferase involved in cell wall biosynthesis